MRGSARSAGRWAGPIGLSAASLCTASLAHALMGALQNTGATAGDYGTHEHVLVIPVALGAIATGATALLCYLLHVAGLERGALPRLARRLGSNIGIGSAVTIALSGAMLLVAMEGLEQLSSGHFDGITSAFGSAPTIGIALICALGLAANAALAGACRCLAGAHVRIVQAIAFIFQGCRDREAPVCISYVFVSAPGHAECANLARINDLRAPPTTSLL